MAAFFALVALAAIAGMIKPYIKGWSRWVFAGIFLASVIGAAIVAPPPPPNANRTKPEKTTAGAQESPEGNAAAGQSRAATPSKWQYSQQRDEMRGTTTRYASLTSENEVEFEFPYGGGSTAELQVRQRPEDGLQILLSVSRGQFICHSFARSRLSVKFDDGPIRTFGCSDPSSGDSDIIFINGPAGFLRSLKNANRVVIEAEFYREGRRQFTFDTRMLTWD